MLSRIAESLYWIGRYTERSESTARVLDVYSHALLEDRRGKEESAGRRLLVAMGVGDHADEIGADVDALIGFLADDPRFPGSIRRSIEAAWDNARGAREALSSEMWESINTTHRLLDVRRGTSIFDRHALFGWVRDRAAVFSGLADTTMSRDDGWRFIVLGRNIERADTTLRLLSTRLGDAWGDSGWVAMLRACGGYEAYLRGSRRGIEPAAALEFLLLDRAFPRSVFHALATAEGVLFDLEPDSSRTARRSEPRRVIGRACAELEFVAVEELTASLPDDLVRLEAAIADAHVAIEHEYFHASTAIRWSA